MILAYEKAILAYEKAILAYEHITLVYVAYKSIWWDAVWGVSMVGIFMETLI